MKILLVEDDEETASFIIKGLNQAGFIVERAVDGVEALDRVLHASYDVAVIDIMLPKLDGLSLIGELRKRKILMPVLVLSAKRAVDDRVKGLMVGGDDYLVKPFAFSELLARFRALVRRSQAIPEPTSLTVGPITMDLQKRKVLCHGKPLVLQPREFPLLEYLMRNQERVVSKTMIMEHVWEYNFDPHTNVVEARMSKLREKLRQASTRELIHTLRGVGDVMKERD